MKRKKRLTIAFFSNPSSALINKANLFHSIIDTSKEIDANLLLYRGGRLNAPLGFEAQGNIIYHFLDKNKVDGIIIASPQFFSFLKNEAEFLEYIKRFNGFPIISSGAEINTIPSVIPDSYTDFTLLFKHLIEDHNKMKIAFIAGPQSSTTAADRLKAYKDSHLKYSIPIDERLISAPYEWGIENDTSSGVKAIKDFLDHRKINFDCVMASNDRFAAGAIYELKRRGIRVPEDVMITGYDDLSLGRTLYPPLTSVPHPQYYITQKAFYLLRDLINGKKVPLLTKVESYIIFRKSCGCHTNKIQEAVASTLKMNSIEKKASSKTSFKIKPVYNKIIFYCKEKKIDYNAEIIKKLIDDINIQIKPASPELILECCENIINSIHDENKLDCFSCILSIINRVYSETYDDINVIQKLQNILYAAQIYLGEAKYLLRLKQHQNADIINKLIQSTNEIISTAFSIPHLLDILYHQFIELGITEAYLSLYKKGDPSFQHSDLIFGLKNKKRLELSKNDTTFPSCELFPASLRDEKKRNVYFVGPLYFHEHHFGILVLKLLKDSGSSYETVLAQISHTLWATILLETHKKNERKLQIKAEELIRSNKDLEQFAYIASHDLQEPLRKITIFSERLQKSVEGLIPDNNDNICRMNNSIKRMQKLIHDLLNYSRTTSSNVTFKKINLNRIIKEILLDLETQISESQSSVNLGKLPTIEGNPAQIRQLFQNLLSNSIKYHKPNVPPQIQIYVKSNNNSFCEIAIKDNGIGIDKKHHEKIFIIFERLHTKSEFEGSGIGLAICQKIVQNHKGKISIESTLGEGTEFTLLLPLKYPEL